jgi:hypothetical protein
MKILSFLNLSNREKPTMDSGAILHKIFFSELVLRGWECALASPIYFNIDGVKDVYYNPGESKYDVRFRFEWNKVSEIVEGFKPDYIFVHQVELAANFRALVETLGLETKILTYWHYMPVVEIIKDKVIWDESLNHANLAEIILLRTFEAVKVSDLFFVTSEFSRKTLFKLLDMYKISLDRNKIFVLNPPVDNEFISFEPLTFKNSKQIFYSSRIYKHYGADFLVDIIDNFKKFNLTFVLSDFFRNRNITRVRLDASVATYKRILKSNKRVELTDEGCNRFFYKHNLLLNSDIVLAPHRKNANWSMSSLDAMGLGIPVIAPNFACYPEFIPKELLYNSKEEAVALIQKLLKERKFWNETSNKCMEISKGYLSKIIVDRFLQGLKKI